MTQAPVHEPGSAPWRQWLEQTRQRSFRYTSTAGHFSGRREAQAERSYWYAYRKSAGRLRKAYLGRSDDLTLERLNAVAAQLATEPHAPSSAAPPATLPATCPHRSLAAHTRSRPSRSGCCTAMFAC